MDIPDVSTRVPVQRCDGSEPLTGGGIALQKRRFGPIRRAIGRLLGVPPRRIVRLDSVGAKAWALMDGRTVQDIRVALESQGIDDAGERLGRLIGTLASHGLIELH